MPEPHLDAHREHKIESLRTQLQTVNEARRMKVFSGSSKPKSPYATSISKKKVATNRFDDLARQANSLRRMFKLPETPVTSRSQTSDGGSARVVFDDGARQIEFHTNGEHVGVFHEDVDVDRDQHGGQEGERNEYEEGHHDEQKQDGVSWDLLERLLSFSLKEPEGGKALMEKMLETARQAKSGAADDDGVAEDDSYCVDEKSDRFPPSSSSTRPTSATTSVGNRTRPTSAMSSSGTRTRPTSAHHHVPSLATTNFVSSLGTPKSNLLSTPTASSQTGSLIPDESIPEDEPVDTSTLVLPKRFSSGLESGGAGAKSQSFLDAEAVFLREHNSHAIAALERAEKERDELVTKILAIKGRLPEHPVQIEQMKSELAMRTATFRDSKDKLTRLTAEEEEEEKKFTEIQARYDRKKAQYDLIASELLDIKDAHSKLELAVTEADNADKSLRDEFCSLEGEVLFGKNQLQDDDLIIDQLSKQYNSIKTETSAAMNQMKLVEEGVRTERERQARELEELTTKRKDFEMDVQDLRRQVGQKSTFNLEKVAKFKFLASY